MNNANNKTPVTILQEFMTQRRDTPEYSLIMSNSDTPHDPLFKYKVTGMGKFAIGSGKSKREAKHCAARLLLLQLKSSVSERSTLLSEVDGCFSPYDNNLKVNAVGELQLFCDTYSLQTPQYDLILDTGPPHRKIFCFRCSVSSLACEAVATTKKQAKHKCSADLLNKLRLLIFDYLDSTDREELTRNMGADPNLKSIEWTKREDADSVDESGDLVSKISCELSRRTANLGYNLSDLYLWFLAPEFPSSPSLESLKLKHGRPLPPDLPDPLELLKTLADELNFELDITPLLSRNPEVFIANIFIVTRPGWSFLGEGRSDDDAINSAALSAIEFLMEMTTPF